MDRYFRVFKFMGQVLGMVKQNPSLLTPFGLNIAVAVPLNIVLVIAVALTADTSPGIAFVMNGVGVVALYYTDYFCNGLTASMIYDQVTTGIDQRTACPAAGGDR